VGFGAFEGEVFVEEEPVGVGGRGLFGDGLLVVFEGHAAGELYFHFDGDYF
jgi:hypothetical protein